MRTCAFCGGHPTSREHVIAEWIAKAIGVEDVNIRISGDVPERLWSAWNTFDYKPRVVCRPCNNGWMSALESDVKPILTPLMRGRNTYLDPWQQRRLAAWLWKTAMVAGLVYKQRPFSDGDVASLWRHQKLPARGIQMSLGTFVGRQRPGQMNFRVGRASAFGAVIGSSYCFWLQLGAVVFEVIYVNAALKMAFFEPKLWQFWPPIQFLRFPGAPGITDAGYQTLVERLDNRKIGRGWVGWGRYGHRPSRNSNGVPTTEPCRG